MTARALVSVILPTFNAESTIVAAIKSVLRQTYSSLELIVINDGSSDATSSLITKIASKDSRVKIVSRANRGLIYSLNEGVELARGQYIARMDADDICLLSRLERQVKYIDEKNVDLCGTYVRTFGRCVPKTWRYSINPDEAKADLLFNSPVAHPTVLGRAEVFKQNPYAAEALYVEDYELWQRLAVQGRRISNVPEVLLRYRKSKSQATSAHRREQDIARLSYAEAFRKKCFPSLKQRWLEILHDRTGTINVLEVSALIDYVTSEIFGRSPPEVERAVRGAMSNFLIHNSSAASALPRGILKAVVGRRKTLLIKSLDAVGLTPLRKERWQYLYYLR